MPRPPCWITRDVAEVTREGGPVRHDVVEAGADDPPPAGTAHRATSPAIAGSRSRSASCCRVTRMATRIPTASKTPYQRGASAPRWKMNGSEGLGIDANSTPRTYRYRPAMEPERAAAPALEGRVAVVAGGDPRRRAAASRSSWVGPAPRSTSRGAPIGASASELGRPETIDETAELVTGAGGRGIAVRVDHRVAAEVRALERSGPSRAGSTCWSTTSRAGTSRQWTGPSGSIAWTRAAPVRPGLRDAHRHQPAALRR